MRLLKEIYYDEYVNLFGKMTFREAVRGIIISDGKILLVYSQRNGDYKIPGGGIKTGETQESALTREIREECGIVVSEINKELGKIVEYKKDEYEKDSVFKMVSYYYYCEVLSKEFGEQHLDDYETMLEFTPVWVDIDVAIENNNKLINSDKEISKWVARETYVLEKIKEEMNGK